MPVNLDVSTLAQPLLWGPRAALPVPKKVGFSTRNLLSFPGRGPAAHAFRGDLRLRRSLLAARSHWRFCCQGSHGAGTRSFRDCRESGLWGDSSETRYLEPNPFVCFPPNQFRECVDNRLCFFLSCKLIWISELTAWPPSRSVTVLLLVTRLGHWCVIFLR